MTSAEHFLSLKDNIKQKQQREKQCDSVTVTLMLISNITGIDSWVFCWKFNNKCEMKWSVSLFVVQWDQCVMGHFEMSCWRSVDLTTYWSGAESENLLEACASSSLNVGLVSIQSILTLCHWWVTLVCQFIKLFFKDQFPLMMVCGCPCGGVVRKQSHPQSCGMYFITVQLHVFYIIYQMTFRVFI